MSLMSQKHPSACFWAYHTVNFIVYHAGICAKGGYEYAGSVYHYSMSLAYAAQAETL